MIEYEGYTGVVEFDPSIDAFHGRVVGLRDVVTFQGTSVDELRTAMRESIEDYLELCAAAGKEPERPYRGEFLVRTTPKIHRSAATAAEAAGKSLNAWVEGVVEAAAERRRSVATNRARAEARRAAKERKKRAAARRRS